MTQYRRKSARGYCIKLSIIGEYCTIFAIFKNEIYEIMQGKNGAISNTNLFFLQTSHWNTRIQFRDHGKKINRLGKPLKSEQPRQNQWCITWLKSPKQKGSLVPTLVVRIGTGWYGTIWPHGSVQIQIRHSELGIQILTFSQWFKEISGKSSFCSVLVTTKCPGRIPVRMDPWPPRSRSGRNIYGSITQLYWTLKPVLWNRNSEPQET
jgi:hypothetical protein